MQVEIKEREDKPKLRPLHELPPAQIVEDFAWVIPQCCREGWKTCKHVLQKQRPTKHNVGL